jgi:hypothetical protein
VRQDSNREQLARSAEHLADLESRYDAHLAALRDRAERARASTDADADALAQSACVEPAEPPQPTP